MKHNLSAKLLALLLAMVMLIGALPISALAAPGGGGGWQKTSVDHIDIGVALEADVYVNGVKKTVSYTLTKSDASLISISAAYGNGTSVSYTRSSVETSTDNEGKAQIRLNGTYPVGTKSDPVYYTVSITKDFIVDGVTVPITLSATIQYWSLANRCPGLGRDWQNGSVSGGSGIDLELGAGEADFGTIQIQKTVEGAALTADKTFVFDILDSNGNVYRTESITVKAGQTTATAFSTMIPYGNYTVVERTASAAIENFEVTTTYVPAGGSVTVGSADSNPNVHVTNKYATQKTDVTATKVWVDNDNQDGIRPESLALTLYADGVKVNAEPEVKKDGNTWTYTWKNLDVNKNGKAIVYTVDETEVPTGYTKTVDGMTVTNTHTPEKKNVTATKVWVDNDNQDGIRPTSLALTLYADGVKVNAEPEITKNGNTWTYTWKNLDVNKNGKAIEYTVDETEVPTGYTKTVDGMTVTNTHTPEKKNVTATKVWVDNDNQDGIRPTSLALTLYADGVKVNAEPEITKNGNTWTYTWKNLDVNKNGKAIVYTVDETAVPTGYTKTVDGMTVTNTHTPEKKNVTATKVWVDNDNQDGIRPTSLALTLYADGVKVNAEPEITKNGNTWTYTWKNLYVNKNGKAIVYTVDETEVPAGYEKAARGLNVTNTHVTEKTDVAATKVWVDNDNQDGIRPESLALTLYADDVKVNAEPEVTKNGNTWTYTWKNLDVNKNGKAIVYTVGETEVPTGYTNTVDGMTVTNTHTPEKTTISGTKTWKGDEGTSYRPDSITVTLYANNTVTNAVPVWTNTDTNVWSYTFENLDRYANGQEIHYTVSEAPVENYITEYADNGYDIVNTLNVTDTGYGEFTIKKIDGETGETIPGVEFVLTDGNGNETVYVTGTDGRATVSGLAVGSYTLTERVPAGYQDFGTVWKVSVSEDYNVKLSETATGGVVNRVWQWITSIFGGEDNSTFKDGVLTVKNYTLITVMAEKYWDDDADRDGKRPEELELTLYANGQPVRGAKAEVVKNGDLWTYTWNNLPKLAGGEAIEYTVVEENVPEGYTASYSEDTLTIVNTHEIELTSITVIKKWDDNGDQDGIRPAEIKVQLLKNGEVYSENTLTAAMDWHGTWIDLPVYENGQEIEWTVREAGAIEGYEASYDGYTIINTHKTETTNKTVTKLWNDYKNKNNTRPDSISVQLYANGKAVGEPVKLTEKGGWTYTWTGLEVNRNGKAIEYTVKEINVPDGYNVRYSKDTFTITNMLKDIPSTGDSFSFVLWAAVIAVSGAAIIAAAAVQKKKKSGGK